MSFLHIPRVKQTPMEAVAFYPLHKASAEKSQLSQTMLYVSFVIKQNLKGRQ